MEYPLASIVILNYNGRKFLDRCLTSVFDQSFSNFEVVLVDNASIDGSIIYVKTRFGHDGRLRIFENTENSGPIEGNNIGIRLANRRARYVVLLNNDTELTENWLSCMINAMEYDPRIGAANSKQLLMDDRHRLQGAGSFIDPCGFNYQLGENEIDSGQYGDNILEIFNAGTTALLVRKELLRKIGLLDSCYFHGFDDVDFCWRVWLSGYKVVCVSSCAMYHKVAGSSSRVSMPFVLFHREKNRIMTAIKNYSVPYQFRILPLILIFDFLQIAWFALTRKLPMFKAIVKAMIWDVGHFRHVWSQHMVIQYNIRKVSDKEITSHMLKINLQELWRRMTTLSQ